MICPACKEQMPSLPKVCPVSGYGRNGDGEKTLPLVPLIAGISGLFTAGQNLIIIINGLIPLPAAAMRCKVGSSRV